MLIKKYLPFIILTIIVVTCSIFRYPEKINGVKTLPVQDPEETSVNSKPVYLNNVTASNYLTSFTNLGMFNYAGAINCLVVDMADSNHLIVGANNGGIWASYNRAASWQPIDDFANSLKVASLVQSPFKLNEFYYSTGLDIYNNGNLLNDIYRSTDGGLTFSNITTIAPGMGRVDKIVCSPVDSNTVYLLSYFGTAGSNGGYVFRTTDNFTSFQSVFHVNGYPLWDLNVMPGGEVAVAEVGKIWQSPTGNLGSFVLTNNGIVANAGFIKLGFCASQPLIRYATVPFNGYNGIYKSVNGGLNWTFLDTLGYGSSPPRISVKPDDPDFIMCGAVHLTVSVDGGLTWQQSVGGYDIRSMNYDPNRVGIMFITSDFGVSSIEVDPLTTTSFTKEYYHDSLLIVQEIHAGDHFSTGNRNLIGSQDLGTNLIKTNQPNAFNFGGDGADAWGSKQDSNIGYFSAQGGMICKSNNLTTSPYGQIIMHQMDSNNDFSIDEGCTFWTTYVMNDADDDQLYFPTLKRLWRSLDGGNNWAPVSNYYGNTYYRSYITASKKSNPIVYWCNYDSIFILPDAATALPLTEFGMAVPGDPLKIMADPFNDSCLYFFKEGAVTEILHSSNLFAGNVQWTNWGINLPAGINIKCLAFSPVNTQIVLAGAREGGVYITMNGGATWSKEIAFPNVQVTDIKIRPSDNKIFIYTYGRGLWSAEFNNISAINEVHNPAFLLYPNPFTNVLNLQLNEPLHDAQIMLTDFQGKVISIKEGDFEKTVSLQCAHISEGVYIVQIKKDKKSVFSGKVIKREK